MEKTLNQAYATFKSEFCNFKIGKTTFQTLRPKNVRLKGAAKRQVCCCLYYQNIEYLQKAVAHILRINKRDTTNFNNNENMCKFLLCDNKNILWIHQICETCSSFPKLANFKRTFSQLHCSDDCSKKTKNCVIHKVKRLQYEQTTYEHKGEQKKKLQLVENFMTLSGLLDLKQQRLCNSLGIDLMLIILEVFGIKLRSFLKMMQ